MTKHNIQNNNGFTVLEMALVLIISGFVMLFLINAYTNYLAEQRVQTTQANMALAQSAIFAYRNYNSSFYPCPADLSLGPNDPNYGVADCTAGDSAGIFNPQSSLDLAPDGGDGTNDRILIGAVPFRTISEELAGVYPLSESISLDGWDNKLVYVVSEDQAKLIDLAAAHPFREQTGVIDIVDEYNQRVVEQVGLGTLAQMALVSHGKNGYGAYSRGGGQVESCNVLTLPSVTPPPTDLFDEVDNCAHDTNATLVSALRNETDHNYFDDYIQFLANYNESIWSNTSPYGAINKNPGSVGIGTNQPQATLHVIGDAYADRIYGKQLCDQSGLNCMYPKFLAGGQIRTGDEGDEEVVNTCPNENEVIYEISENKVSCRDPLENVEYSDKTCPPGQYMKGVRIKAGIGEPICKEPD